MCVDRVCGLTANGKDLLFLLLSLLSDFTELLFDCLDHTAPF